MSAQTSAETDALNALRELLPVGSTVRTILRHTSKSGMSRAITVHTVTDGAVRDITWLVSQVTGYRLSQRHEGLTVGGCGMDMGFAVVYALSSALYPTGHRCTGSTGRTPAGNRSAAPACPSNDHTNDYGRLAREYDAAYRDAHDGNDGGGPEYVSARQQWISEQKTYSRTRQHRDGGYALRQQWL